MAKKTAAPDWSEQEGPIRIVEGAFRLDASNFDALLRREDALFLVLFTVPWSVPCKQVAPMIDEIAASLGDGKEFYIGKVDAEKEALLARRQGIGAVPTVVLYHQGEEKGRIEGANTSAARLRSLARKYLLALREERRGVKKDPS